MEALAVLDIFITHLVQSFNVGKTMNAFQIADTCQMILTDFWHLKIADLQVFITQAKAGRFGKLYDRIDCQVIIEWLTTYDTQRMDAASRRRPKLIDISMPVINQQSNDPLPIYEKVKEPTYSYRTIKELSPMQKLHNKWLDQYYKLLNKQNYFKTEERTRFVRKYGKMLDANEYLLYKQGQYNKYNNANIS